MSRVTYTMVLIGATALKNLSKKEIRVLQAVEVGMRTSEYVEISQIAKFAGYAVPDTERWLQNCHKLNLVHRWTGHFTGYELTIHAYDLLALNALYEKGVIQSIGRERGVGKESKVYHALGFNNKEVILKLHRVGFTSFQHVRKKRRYTASKRHISELYASRLSAEEERTWLEKANELKLSVPKVIGSNRHILVLELIDGIDLVKLQDLPDPTETFEEIIEFIRTAWQQGKFVHGDLSEHNIIVTHDEAKAVIIDFPQAISTTEVNAEELLDRDIGNIITYFDRKHKLNVNFDEIKSYITQV